MKISFLDCVVKHNAYSRFYLKRKFKKYKKRKKEKEINGEVLKQYFEKLLKEEKKYDSFSFFEKWIQKYDENVAAEECFNAYHEDKKFLSVIRYILYHATTCTMLFFLFSLVSKIEYDSQNEDIYDDIYLFFHYENYEQYAIKSFKKHPSYQKRKEEMSEEDFFFEKTI